jgi:outer membrane lipoprotein-sorting protein
MMRTILLLFLLSQVVYAATIRNGEDVLRAMRERYPSWYRTLTFTQKSTTYKPDGTSSAETWHEAASIPGKLRIDIGPAANGNGYVLVDGTITIIKDNKVAATRKSVNVLLVLGFDVYGQDAATTANVVKGEGYDLSKVREDTWDGKAVYVVGADKGDLKSRQFWVEKGTLLFVREIEPARGDPGKLNDIRFTHYQPLDGGWVAAGVEVYSEGKKVFSEDYTDIQANVKLDPGTFDPQQFSTTHWEK